MRIRIKFKKYGVMKFVGHLDMMRYFQKCMRRADIAIAYSEGFRPHQIMSFAAPLGVGATSDGEYLDIEVTSTKSSRESLLALNEVMADGVLALSYRKLGDTDKKAMAAVAAADYTLWIKDGYPAPAMDYQAALQEFFYQPKEILVTKQTKKSIKTLDLKKLVYDFQVEVKEGRPIFYLKVSTGSVDNLKPELVMAAFYEFLGMDFNPLSIQVHRNDLYGEQNGELKPFGEMGEEIG